MRETLQTYEEYKDSGLAWLGSIPSDWPIVRNKEIFKERGSVSNTGQETLLTVSHITGVTPRSEKNVNMFMAETMVGYKICHEGDLIINTMWAWMGALGTSNELGICSPSYNVYMPQKGIPYNRRYFDYLFRIPNAVMEMTRNSKGIVSSRLRLYAKDFFQIEIVLPSLQEQEAIAHYLDTKTVQIDRKIDLLTQKAQRYEELKRSLINETVTRGLDKSVPMKDSEIEWIDEIPEHWEIRRIKDITISDVSVKTPSQLKGADLIEFVPMSNVDESLGAIKEYSFVELDSVSSGYTKFKNDDVIFAKITPCMENGNVALVKDLRYGIGFGSTEFMVFRSRKELFPKYLHYFFHNILFRKNAEPFMKGTAGQKRITSLYMSTHGFGLPPLDEQKTIADYLDKKTAHIDRVIANINSQIDIQKELRKTLINDVVTGKIKVA
ncbi:restriction endonuclease subunit S [Pseudanabaena sp. FACHB-2040]|uniref:restriction endonuclease subunit S n=1 Tax=Pseudanabaena sp. FACHB-2040 TaxID=2692859 RepID=UPI0016863538|nr:restriction endonuclease subunit S [Pseudanabaena sp. FACHB-2040]MBD2258616.1 restriction endonuclease subunit S [Pseudanabaena sp. FACHB-2040]